MDNLNVTEPEPSSDANGAAVNKENKKRISYVSRDHASKAVTASNEP